MNSKTTRKINIDIFQLATTIWKDWKKTSLWCITFGVFGVIVAFSIPRIYKSNVLLAPETSSTSGILSSVSSLASMVGLDANAKLTTDAIYPEIYPDLIKSTDFLIRLFDIQVATLERKKKTSYYDYLLKHQKHTWWSYPLRALAKLFKKEEQKKRKTQTDDEKPYLLSKTEFGILKKIENNIECNVDKKTDVISITIKSQYPLVSATMADSVKENLQSFITKYRTQKAKNDLAFIEKLFKESKEQYNKARQQYASFCDANAGVILQSVKSRQEELENEMQLQYNIYSQVAQQLQMAKAKVQERTPAFTVVQSATVPVKHSNVPKIFILAFFVILGFVIRICILLYKNPYLLVCSK